VALARKRGWRLRSVEIPVCPEERGQGSTEALGEWLETAATWLGLEAEPVAVPYAEVEALVRGAAPALIRLPATAKPGFLVLLGSQRHRVTLLGPDLRTHRVAVEMVRTALCQAVEAPLLAEVEQVLEIVGVAGRRRVRAQRTILRERLSAERLGGCWILRLPAGASFWQQLRQAICRAACWGS
jgi:ATP-binding cassette subfamily B protein